MDDLQKQMRSLQDMLQGAINQRTASQNECLQLAAQVAALSRELEAANKKIEELTPKDAEATAPKANGKSRVPTEKHATQ